MGCFIVGCIFLLFFIADIIFLKKTGKDIFLILAYIFGVLGFFLSLFFLIVWSNTESLEKDTLQRYEIACYCTKELESGKAVPYEVAKEYIKIIDNINYQIKDNKKYNSWWRGKLYSKTIAELEPIYTNFNISVVSNEIL